MKLEDIPKKNIYQVPEGYFDKLPNRVMAQVRKDVAGERNAFFTFGHFAYLRGALAGLVLLVLFTWCFLFTLPDHTPLPTASLLNNISDTEALDYLIRTERLETQDLVVLSQTDQDLTYDFIQVSREDILREVDDADLEEIYAE